MKGEITQHIDVAQIVLYAFWAFFAYLIYWLRREDKREGYPLEFERPETAPYLNFPPIPKPKTFVLPHGGIAVAPRVEPPQPPLRAEPVAAWPGAPLEPTGDPMTSGAGPGAYAMRADTPDLTLEGLPKIVPLRIATGTDATQGTQTSDSPTSRHYKYFTLSPDDPDPRGMQVLGADGVSGGVVTDVWIDVSEVIIRYLEVAPTGATGTVLVPMTFARIDARSRAVIVKAVLASQLAGVPSTKGSDVVTFLEEDRICAYFGGGTLYATPGRREALL
jgi:photosynthetic reaction center H subunit